MLNEYDSFKSTLKVFYCLAGQFSLCIINPRRACARGLQYLSCLSVCVCVCVFSLFWHLAQSGVQTAVSATSARYGHEI